MDENITEFIINDHVCHFCEKGGCKNIILWGTSKGNGENIKNIQNYLDEMLPDGTSYTLISFEVQDWFSDFSPWKMVTSTGDNFLGDGETVLQLIREELVPFIYEKYPENENIYITGYSLAGLFSLWAFYETGIFSGAACCSGSLWFENWDEYAEKKAALKKSKIYLSLGGKEANSKNPYMSTIDKQYKKQEARLKKDKNVTYIYEMNSGGHFANPDKRMAKAMAWLLK